MISEEEARSALEGDPGDPRFVDYADNLRKEKRLEEALLVSLRGVSVNPNLAKGRLILGRIFYDMGLHSFAAREVKELLASAPENKTLKRLSELLNPGEGVNTAEGVIAESDFDVDLLEAAAKSKDS